MHRPLKTSSNSNTIRLTCGQRQDQQRGKEGQAALRWGDMRFWLSVKLVAQCCSRGRSHKS